MLNMDEIRKQLEDRNLAAVAKKLHITRSWLQAVRAGKPCSEELQKRLSDYLTGK